MDFDYQAAPWDKERSVRAKIEWHPGELFPRVGLIVTNLPKEPDWVVKFYNQRGTAEQHIKEGEYAFRWTRLPFRKFRDGEFWLQVHALAFNLAAFLRCIELPEAKADWSCSAPRKLDHLKLEFLANLPRLGEELRTIKASRFTEAQKAFVLNQGEEGTPVAEICRKAGISQATNFNWKKRYGRLLPDEMRRLKVLEDENSRFKKIVADLTVEREMLQDVIRRKL